MLVMNPTWDIKVSKTGYINEAGQCLVMVARINNRDMAIVLLNAEGKGTRVGDAVKIKQWVQQTQVIASPDQPSPESALPEQQTKVMAALDGIRSQ
jgi:D-alanyl-D-alanine endopeptidase (penicillin-binding protein 7)